MARGARGARGLSIAAALALLALPALLPSALVALAPSAGAQSTTDPWWGPAERANPTKGWSIRIPVVVENDDDTDARTNHVVAVDLDIGALLVKAGWTNETKGTDVRPRGFTLDVDSIRVVEYVSGFGQGPIEGANTKPVPHQFYTQMWRAPRYQEFDARDPAGTVLFLVPGLLAPQTKRYFYVYANPLEYGDLPPATFTLAERAPLDAYLWASRGTTVYGYEPGGQTGQGHQIHIALPPMTSKKATVTVFELAPGSGRFTPVAATSTQQNPFALTQGPGTNFFIQGGRPYKIVSDRDIVVTGTGQPHPDGGSDGGGTPNNSGTPPYFHQTEAFGFVPSTTNGTFTGRLFMPWGVRGDGPQPGANGYVYAIAAKPKSITVTAGAFPGGATGCVGAAGAPSVTLTAANRVAPLLIPINRYSVVCATDDIMLSYSPPTVGPTQPQQTIQVPAVSGGPTGVAFYSPVTPDRGIIRACAEENSTVRIVGVGSPDTQLMPQGSVSNLPPHVVRRAPFCETTVAPLGTPTDQWELYAESTYPTPHDPVPFRLFTGAPTRPNPVLDRGAIGYYGGAGATDFQVRGPTGIFGHFNNTRVTIFEEKEATLPNGTHVVTNRTITLSADQYFALVPPNATGPQQATGAMRIVSQKPITVVSLDEVALYNVRADGSLQRSGDSMSYVVSVPGRPTDLKTAVGQLEFRGPLVDLRAPDTTNRIVTLSTGPGTPVTFRLDVLNLGRWLGGESLPDTIRVRCSGPASWKIEDCDRTVDLASGQAERIGIRVTPGADEIDASEVVFVEAQSKTPGVNATFRLGVIVEVRYGVGLWLGAVGGEKRVDPPVGLNPGEAHTYRIWIKNLGSTTDNFTLTLDAPRAGWTQALTLGGEPVSRVRLDGGQAKEMLLRVVAPDAESAPTNDVTLTAVSETSANAGDQVNTVTRIRPKVNVKMVVDPQTQQASPNETAVFNVSLNNSGNDVFRVVLRQEATRTWPAQLEQDDVYINPGDTLVLKLRVTPPPDARAGDLASVKLTADVYTGGATSIVGDQVSAVTVVRRVHNLTIPAVPEAQARPGETMRYVLPVQNLGNGQDVVELLPGAVTRNWTVTLETATVTLPYNETGELPLVIGVPPGTPEGVYNVTFTARLSRETFQNLSIPVQVLRVAKVDFVGAASIATTAGRPTHVALVARNAGNVGGVFALTADAPASWNVTFSPETVRLEPGGELPVTLTVNASRDAPDGATALRLLASMQDQPAGETPLRVDLAKPQLAISKVEATGRLTRGELVVVAATVRNSGAIAAENVSVALVVDGKVVDRTTLSRIPVNTSAVATLSWVATASGGAAQVVLDPDQEIVQASRDETVAEVSFGSRVPFVGALASLTILVAIAIVSRRRA